MLTACGLLLFAVGLAPGGGRVSRLLVPPALPEAATEAREVNGLRYSVATGRQCWAAELPCAERELPRDVTLRDPARGLSAGFVRNDER
jgi:hypothetical protein